jgi:hypothetical protein
MESQGSSPREASVPLTASVCGLLCDACSIFIASHEDPERLAAIAASWGNTVEDTYCEGCRADSRTSYCRDCTLFACAGERGHAFCSECDDFPCVQLEEFRQERPHRTEIYENLARISKAGVETWMREAKAHYACPSCHTLNSAYDLKCRKCGHEPANAYVVAHRDAIVERLRQM